MNLQETGQLDVAAALGPRFDKVKVFYSTPEYFTKQKFVETKKFYVSAVENPATDIDMQASLLPWTTKTDDFFPYSDCDYENCYWTGYFTSRTSLKRLERVASSFLLAARQLEALVGGEPDSKPLFALEDAVGVLQHHDGVTGTSKQHVAYDYAKRVQEGMNQAAAFAEQQLRVRTGEGSSESTLEWKYCQLLNETICDVQVCRVVAGDSQCSYQTDDT